MFKLLVGTRFGLEKDREEDEEGGERGTREEKEEMLSPFHMPGSVLCVLPVLSHFVITNFKYIS